MAEKILDIAIFCVGNYYLSDDGFGIHLFKILRDTSLPENVQIFEFGGTGFFQTDIILPYRKLIVADALKGLGMPGEIFRFDLLENPCLPYCKTMVSSHDFGIMELLDMVRTLRPENLPKQAILFGAEADITDRYGTTLSPRVDKALSGVKEMIIEEVSEHSS